MNGITIAPASEADIPDLIDLLTVLFSIEQDFSPDPDKQGRGLAALLASPTGHIAIARDTTSRAVGMATAQLVISTAEGAPSAWIEDVVVREDFRGKGLGRALLDTVLAWARSQGAVRAATARRPRQRACTGLLRPGRLAADAAGGAAPDASRSLIRDCDNFRRRCTRWLYLRQREGVVRAGCGSIGQWNWYSP